jgi:predicted HAD superfamily Cof-like phosphohydrolase
VFREIKEFNDARRLIEKGYNESKESSFILEELTEVLRANDREEKVDGYADIIVFAVGAIYKLGYDAEIVMSEVCNHINSEVGGHFDEEQGKYIKGKRMYDTDFSKAEI